MASDFITEHEINELKKEINRLKNTNNNGHSNCCDNNNFNIPMLNINNVTVEFSKAAKELFNCKYLVYCGMVFEDDQLEDLFEPQRFHSNYFRNFNLNDLLHIYFELRKIEQKLNLKVLTNG